MKKQLDDIDERMKTMFTLLEFKGKGAYGVVWKAQDKISKKVVALKKIFDAFANDTDAQRTYREVVFLTQLTDHDNIIKLLQIYRAENNKDLYMTFEFMETDLHKVIRADVLTPAHMQYIIYQLLKCLKYLHSAELIHRDLKPSNLLIDQDCKIKVADFGLARFLYSQDEEPQIMTEYVATRWYRAPEILMGSQHYSKAIDMWSVGIILSEMILGSALFTGTSTFNQIEKIIELLGKPTSQDIEAMQLTQAQELLNQIKINKKKTFASVFKVSEEFIDFIRKCLTWSPLKRLSIESAMKHKLVERFLGSESEPLFTRQIHIQFNENDRLSLQCYRDVLYSMDKNQAYKQYLNSKLANRRVKTQLDDDEEPLNYPPMFKPTLIHNSRQISLSQHKMVKEAPFRSRSLDKPKLETLKPRPSKVSPPKMLEVKASQVHQLLQSCLENKSKKTAQFSMKKISHHKNRSIVDIKRQIHSNSYYDVQSIICQQPS